MTTTRTGATALTIQVILSDGSSRPIVINDTFTVESAKELIRDGFGLIGGHIALDNLGLALTTQLTADMDGRLRFVDSGKPPMMCLPLRLSLQRPSFAAPVDRGAAAELANQLHTMFNAAYTDMSSSDRKVIRRLLAGMRRSGSS